MRMGKLSKSERVGKFGEDANVASKFSKGGTVIGQVSVNWINSVFLPEWEVRASKSMEDYLHAQIEYEEAVKAQQEEEAQVDVDGNVNVSIPSPPVPPIFHSQFVINDFRESIVIKTAKEFSAPSNQWKVRANAARFERKLDEKYGIFRPFVENHPEIDVFFRSMQRKYAMGEFSPFRQTPPPMARSTSIILLFMMHRNGVPWQIMVLSVLFLLVGLQPWVLVMLCVILQWLLHRRKNTVIGDMDSEDVPITMKPYYNNDNKISKLLEPVGQPIQDSTTSTNNIGSDYDTILLGQGAATLYLAALLSRSGRKVLVLSSAADASGCLNLQNFKKNAGTWHQVPFDFESHAISMITRQQELLVPALSTSTDYQGGIRFVQIGTMADGHAFEILSIPGMGTSKSTDEIPFVLRADGGIQGLMDDTATFLGDGWPDTDQDGGVGDSLAGAYVEATVSMNASAGSYFLSKILPDSVNDFRSKTTYGEASIRFASNLLDQCFALNAHVRSLFAGIGNKGENIPPNKTSMGVHISHICAALSGEGMHYPVGGPRALCHAFASVVEQCGGKILTNAEVKELMYDESSAKLPPPTTTQAGTETEEAEVQAPRCVGVKLTNGTSITFPKQEGGGEDNRVVVSTDGFIDTFIRYTPDKIRNIYKVPRGLPALSEQRPVFKILCALKGTAQDLNITGADFFRLPSASLAMDEINPETGAVTLGEIGGSGIKETSGADDEEAVSQDAVNDESAAESSSERNKKKSTSNRNKYYAGRSWIQISFPSAKDPSFEERFGDISTCVLTIEADDDFVTPFDTKPQIYSIPKKIVDDSLPVSQRILGQAKKDLLDAYPQLQDKILHMELRGPFSMGLSHNPERYAAKGIRVDTPYPGLLIGGGDITVGQSLAASFVSSWLVANAIMGYSAVDLLFLEKNITNDLERFIETPEVPDDGDEDVAVPFTPKMAPSEEQTAGEHEEETKKDK